MKELEEKSCEIEEDVSELKADLEAARMNLNLTNQRSMGNKKLIKVLEEKIEALSNIPQAAAPIVPDIDFSKFQTEGIDMN